MWLTAMVKILRGWRAGFKVELHHVPALWFLNDQPSLCLRFLTHTVGIDTASSSESKCLVEWLENNKCSTNDSYFYIRHYFPLSCSCKMNLAKSQLYFYKLRFSALCANGQNKLETMIRLETEIDVENKIYSLSSKTYAFIKKAVNTFLSDFTSNLQSRA